MIHATSVNKFEKLCDERKKLNIQTCILCDSIYMEFEDRKKLLIVIREHRWLPGAIQDRGLTARRLEHTFGCDGKVLHPDCDGGRCLVCY